MFRHADHGVLRVLRVDGRPVGRDEWLVTLQCTKATPAEVAFLEACEVDLREAQSLAGA